MRALAVSSRAATPAEAILEVAAELRARRGRLRPDASAALVFASGHHAEAPQLLSAALEDALGPIPFLGWVGASAFHDWQLSEGAPGLCILLLEDVAAHVRSVPLEGLGALVAARLTADAPIGRARLLSLSADPFDHFGLMIALDEWAPPMAGGLSATGPGGLSAPLAPGMGEAPAAAMLTLSEGNLLLGVAQGVKRAGPAREVTRAEGNLVYELDGRPALEMLLRDLPASLRDQLPRLAGTLFAGLSTFDGQSYVMRHVMGLDPTTGIVSVSGEPEVGTDLVFALCDGDAARADLDLTLQSMHEALAGRTPVATVVFTCVARNEALMGTPAYDVRRTSDVVPAGPVVGVSVPGEICTYGLASSVFSHAAVVAMLLDDSPRPAVDLQGH